jgi:predicted RNA methylase
MSTRHDTPTAVASVLARYAPVRLERLLDPATGTGVLIRPFLKMKPNLEVTCIDINRGATTLVEAEFRDHHNVEILTIDFLCWARNNILEKFDCVVMNPPFAARRSHLVKLTVLDVKGNAKERFVATEIAFAYTAINMLKEQGRLLAILPSSIISTESGRWLRQELIRSGAVHLVHELPPRTFSGVDGKFFLLVYERGVSQARIALRNHRLRKPDELFLSKETVDTHLRFDFAFHDAAIWHKRIRTLSDLEWQRFGDIADCWRGEVSSPITQDEVLHTTNFSTFKPPILDNGQWKRPVRRGDLIVKRVGRDCGSSWLPYVRRRAARCSDCIFIIRPKRPAQTLQLLFSLRVLLSGGRGTPLIEHGVAAAYITKNALDELILPVGLADSYPKSFNKFTQAVRERRWDDLVDIEAQIRRRLQTRSQSNA